MHRHDLREVEKVYGSSPATNEIFLNVI